MTQPDARLLIIVPTRSRPENVAKVVRAWEDTDAFRHADLLFAIERDDPKFSPDYQLDIHDAAEGRPWVKWEVRQAWVPMVHKLNYVAAEFSSDYFAIGFAGDDHLPRTHGWASRYLETLIEMGTGIVSCPDGYRDDDLPTQWAMTADIVRALGRMVPAPVEHLYCDDAVRDLAKAADCWRYLDDVLIEHMHPLSKTSGASWDDQYRRVNRPEQFERDSEAYESWRAQWPEVGRDSRLLQDTEIVRELRKESR